MAGFKIAVATPDGEHLSAHFGETPWYEVFTVEEGQIVARERRAKPHHSHGQHEHHTPGEGCGGGQFFGPIRDCRVLIVGGMGRPAYARAQEAGLEVFPAGGTVEEAVRAYLAGTLQADMRRIHRGGGGHRH